MAADLAKLGAAIYRRLPLEIKAPLYRAWELLPRKRASMRYGILRGRVRNRLRKEIIKLRNDRRIIATTNCGLIYVKGGFLGVYKEGNFNSCWELNIKVPEPKGIGVSQKLWLVELDEMLGIRRTTQLEVALAEHEGPVYELGILEDARLTGYGDDIVVTANFVPFPDGRGSFPDQPNAWPLIGILTRDSAHIQFRRLAFVNARPPEKNWIPVCINGCLYLQYSIDPHLLLDVDLETGVCSERFSTVNQELEGRLARSLKGGAPPVDIDGALLGGCHSWGLNSEREREYLTYFFWIEKKPPFPIISVSAPLKLVVPDRIQYLTSIVPLAGGDSVLLSYGTNDCDNYFVEVKMESIKSWF